MIGVSFRSTTKIAVPGSRGCRRAGPTPFGNAASTYSGKYVGCEKVPNPPIQAFETARQGTELLTSRLAKPGDVLKC